MKFLKPIDVPVGSTVNGSPVYFDKNLDTQMATNVYGSSYDSTAKIYTVIDYKRKDGTLKMHSVLSNPDAGGHYQTLVIDFYDIDGITKLTTQTWTLTYDTDGNVVSKVVS